MSSDFHVFMSSDFHSPTAFHISLAHALKMCRTKNYIEMCMAIFYLGNSPCTLQTYSFSISLFLIWLSSSWVLVSVLIKGKKSIIWMWRLLISDCMLNISWSEQQTLCGMFHGVGSIMHESAPMPMPMRSETTIWDLRYWDLRLLYVLLKQWQLTVSERVYFKTTNSVVATFFIHFEVQWHQSFILIRGASNASRNMAVCGRPLGNQLTWSLRTLQT